MKSTTSVRTRFAPSPTGFLHIGGLRTALFSWLYARKNKGQFILRIEDTDQARFVPGSIEQITEALKWVGLEYDEGPDVGGPYGPYIQSERLALYRGHAETLLGSGAAYYCFCTPERLQIVRDAQAAQHLPPQYDRHCRILDPEETKKLLERNVPYVVRLKLPEQGTVIVNDHIRGKVTFAYDTLDDSVLLKSDGHPTYHLAVVVDDHRMEISHAFRAEEWLPSTPKHLFLYESFGWTPPQFAHFPVILSPKGGKLSKRDGAVSVLAYRDHGYLPEALVNFLALLGWNPKNDNEEMTLDELVEAFSLDGVQKSGAIFDQRKLDHLNGRYIRKLSPQVLLTRAGELAADIRAHFPGQEESVVALLQDRLVTLDDLTVHGAFLIAMPDYDAEILVPKKGNAERTAKILEKLSQYYATLDVSAFHKDHLHDKSIEFVKAQGWSNAESLWPLRVALSGQAKSPGVFEIAAVLGKKESSRRLDVAREKLKKLA